MKQKLSIKAFYDDFILKVSLSSEEKEILDMYISNYSYVEIGMKLNMSERKIGKIIAEIKQKYEQYKELEMHRLNLFIS